MRYLLLSLFLLACGAPPPPEDNRLHGDFTAAYLLKSTEGTCSWLDMEAGGGLKFNQDGEAVSPVPELIKCQTTYGGQYPIFITCQGFGATLEARGWVRQQEAWGNGTAKGNIGGCTFVKFVWSITPKE